MLPTKFRFIWPSGFGEDFLKSSNQKQELPVAAMFVNGSGQNVQSLERTFYASYQASVHLAEEFQRRRLKCEKLMDDKWWQKLTLPLARWAKKKCNIFRLLFSIVWPLKYKKMYFQRSHNLNNKQKILYFFFTIM